MESTFIERIVKEKEELDVKRHALRSFLYTGPYDALPGMQQVLLVKQNNIMEQYSDILQERLRLLGKESECCHGSTHRCAASNGL